MFGEDNDATLEQLNLLDSVEPCEGVHAPPVGGAATLVLAPLLVRRDAVRLVCQELNAEPDVHRLDTTRRLTL